MRKLLNFIDKCSACVGYVAAWIVLPLIFATVYEVFSRYALNAPTIWAYELGYMATGSGFLLGEGEGTTYAVIEGCTVPVGGNSCGANTRSEIPVTPAEPFSRTDATFPFSPHIAGISAGRFEGRLSLVNVFPDGSRTEESGELTVAYDLLETTVTAIGSGGSVGQYIDIDGGGFVQNVEHSPTRGDRHAEAGGLLVGP